jgi:hypothetical protein
MQVLVGNQEMIKPQFQFSLAARSRSRISVVILQRKRMCALSAFRSSAEIRPQPSSDADTRPGAKFP